MRERVHCFRCDRSTTAPVKVQVQTEDDERTLWALLFCPSCAVDLRMFIAGDKP